MSDLRSLSDTDLIRSAQGGNRRSFEELVYRYDKRVLSLAVRYLRDPDDAQDVYQEVFLRVHRSIGKFQLRSEFSTWLYRITANVCLTHASRRKRTLSGVLERDGGAGPADASQADRHTLDLEIRDRVARALEILSPQQRLVFTLKHYDGFKLREIASMIECTEGTVKKHLFTATQRMREQLKDLYE